jgi:hypothetical protein
MKLRTVPERSVDESVAAFIRRAQISNPFGRVEWDAPFWTIPKRTRASKGRNEDRIWLGAAFVAKSTKSNFVPFDQPLGDFVRAFLCDVETKARNPLSPNNLNEYVRAFRYLNEVMASGDKKHPGELMAKEFDAASDLLLKREAESSAYQIGKRLATIAKTMDRERLSMVRLNWANKIKRQRAVGGMAQMEVDALSQEKTAERLPSDEIFAALGEISNRSDLSDPDLIRQRALDIEVCSGLRLNELLMLPVNCLIDEQIFDLQGKAMRDREGNPVIRYGLRYVNEKRKIFRTKWLSTRATEIVKRAITDITGITQPYRDIATYQDKYPGRTKLAWDEKAFFEDQLFSFAEAGRVIGITGNYVTGRVKQFLGKDATDKSGDLPVSDSTGVTAQKLVRAILKRSGSPIVFPGGEVDLRLKDMLFVVPMHFFHQDKVTINGTARVLAEGQLRDYVVSRGADGERSDKGVQSIFERGDYRDKSGGTLSLAGFHTFRRWWDTVAQRGGLSDYELARWQGRTEIRQNDHYDMRSPVERARHLRKQMGTSQAIGPMGTETERIRDPIRRQEFLTTHFVAVHETGFGGCNHHFASPQCPEHQECSVCNQLFVMKGHPVHKTNTQDLYERQFKIVELNKKAVAENIQGADNWLVYQRKKLRRLKMILAIHADDNIPDGTSVQLPENIEDEEEDKDEEDANA